MSSFFSCYDSIKLMDKQTFLLFPNFSENYKFEEDMQYLIQNTNSHTLKEFLWMIKLIKVKDLQVNHEKLLFYLLDSLSYNEGETSFIESFDLYKKALRLTINSLIKKRGTNFDQEQALYSGQRLIEFLSSFLFPISFKEALNNNTINSNNEKHHQNELQNFLWNFVGK